MRTPFFRHLTAVVLCAAANVAQADAGASVDAANDATQPGELMAAATFPAPGQAYRVLSATTQLALDVDGASTSIGANIHGYAYHQGSNQRWTFLQVSNNTYYVVNVNSGQCLSVHNASLDDGATMVQWTCNGGTNQQFHLASAGNGAYTLTAQSSNKCLDLWNNQPANGTVIQQWTCWGGTNQTWLVQPVDSNGAPITGTPAPAPTPTPAPTTGTAPSKFGNTHVHPERIGFYMVPDLDPSYKIANGSPAGWCGWTTTQASLFKLNQLMPNAWIRWDNETGHYSDDPQSVSTFVSCANAANVGMVITASAIDGYNNWWANGNKTPNASLIDFANGPYLAHTAQLASTYPVVKFVETANEPDGPWFNSDGDNVDDFNYYLGKVRAALGGNASKILGPSAASIYSNIWSNYSQSGATNLSYHTYGGASSLVDVAGHNTYVTEYGGFNLDPGAVLADLYNAETQNKLSGGIQKLFYQQITDNGGNRGAFNHNAIENNHFALRDWFRALTLYQALGNVSTSAYMNSANQDFVATDSGTGAFATLVWNNSSNSMQGQTRTIPGASLANTNNLYVAHVGVGDTGTGQCQALGAQSWVSVKVSGSQVQVTVNNLEAHATLLVTTQNCSNLAN